MAAPEEKQGVMSIVNVSVEWDEPDYDRLLQAPLAALATTMASSWNISLKAIALTTANDDGQSSPPMPILQAFHEMIIDRYIAAQQRSSSLSFLKRTNYVVTVMGARCTHAYICYMTRLQHTCQHTLKRKYTHSFPTTDVIMAVTRR